MHTPLSIVHVSVDAVATATDEQVIADAMADGARVVERLQRSTGWRACIRLWATTGLVALFAIVAGIVLGTNADDS
jgi:hypothetical protein